ncbi:hypothetical protein DSUL_80045 [Desulfovibrionales bacterium]
MVVKIIVVVIFHLFFLVLVGGKGERFGSGCCVSHAGDRTT